jgi:putative selenium metabolism hydrolase
VEKSLTSGKGRIRGLKIDRRDVSAELLTFTQQLVRIKSFSGQEEQVAKTIASKMESLGYDEVRIDSLGNVLGRIGSGKQAVLFESHTDTVRVHDEDLWDIPPFSGEIKDGFLWGRGSVDMKSGLAASVYAAAIAKDAGLISGKTIYVSCSVFEEDCDGEGIKHMLNEYQLEPGYAVICEPSANLIAVGHKGKAQIIIKTKGASAHSSAPEKGVNAVYEMAEIIQRVEQTNRNLMKKKGRRGTLVLSRISSTGVSLNAVPSECEIYLDRRMVPGETEQTLQNEMEKIIAGNNATWEIDTIYRTAWTGAPIIYRPLHTAWEISRDHHLTCSSVDAYTEVFGRAPQKFEFWDFSTNAVALVDAGIPTIGFGPGEHKLAHMRNERCAVNQILDACVFYSRLIEMI